MATGAADGVRDAHVDASVVLATDHFDADFEALTSQHGFRVVAIFPADAPTTVPTAPASSEPATPTASEMRPASIIRTKRSRPNRSVPSR